MENQQLSDVKGKELVAAGHAFAKAIGMDTPLIEIAKMVSVLATRLDCALVRGDACMQAEMVWEKAMMAAIGEDGVGCVVRAIAELKAERDALAAENVAQSSSLKALATLNNRLWQWTSRMSYNASYVGEPEGMVKGYIREMEKILDATGKDTPATDAYLNSVRAEGAIAVRDALVLAEDGADIYATSTLVAAQLRAGKDGE
ncbi:hypothetical protein WKH53_14555 [Pantoea agglomerans]|uniref:hypothetical protein n=1 Tax=Enterobacter agglomerans TaxID=549 RepID=UPI003C7B78F2